jgi:hypothetical protein
VVLENGAVWQVDALDRIKTTLWLPVSQVAECGNLLVNLNAGEAVNAQPIAGKFGYVGGSSGPWHVVQAATGDETFVVGNHVFKAKTYCFGVESGDRVLFVSGRANGVCTSAAFLVARTEKICNVWCE